MSSIGFSLLSLWHIVISSLSLSLFYPFSHPSSSAVSSLALLCSSGCTAYGLTSPVLLNKNSGDMVSCESETSEGTFYVHFEKEEEEEEENWNYCVYLRHVIQQVAVLYRFWCTWHFPSNFNFGVVWFILKGSLHVYFEDLWINVFYQTSDMYVSFSYLGASYIFGPAWAK